MGGKRKGRKVQRGGQQHGRKAKQEEAAAETVRPQTKGKKKQEVTSNSHPIPGLVNLGNTCFFNAVIQNLAQTQHLKKKLNEIMRKEPWQVELSPLSDLPTLTLSITDCPQPFTTTLSQFLDEMSLNEKKTLNPRPVFDLVCKKAPRFRGYQQQDGQELLRYLLDALRTEEVHRIKRAILCEYKVTGSGKKESINTLTEKEKKAIKDYGQAASLAHTFVDDVFGGQLASTVKCMECQTCSELQEDFLDLSLSIPVIGTYTKKKSDKGRCLQKEQIMLEEEKKGEWLKCREDFPTNNSSKHQAKKARKEQRKKMRKNKDNKDIAGDCEVKDFTQQYQEEEEEVMPPVTGSHLQEHDIEDCEGRTTDDQSQVFDSQNTAEETLRTPTNPSPPEVGITNCAFVKITAYTLPLPPSPNESDSCLNSKQFHFGDNSTAAISCELSASFNSLSLNSEHAKSISEPQESVQVRSSEEMEHDAETHLHSSSTQEVECTSQPDVRQLDPFSIEACLQNFCSREVLTGDNKFACEVCTKRQHGEVREKPENREEQTLVQDGKEFEKEQENVDHDGEQPDLSTKDSTLPSLDTQYCDKHGQDVSCHCLSSAVDIAEVIGNGLADQDMSKEEKEEHVISSSSSVNHNQVNSSADCEELDDAEESDGSSMSHSSVSVQSERCVDVVFCEAIKQLLISSPPRVLCLHLKRFSQQGRSMRSLRKNGSHIAFPLVLNMAPFCTQNCMSLFNSAGQLMYSLYGVVEHSGNMHGGHYTSYTSCKPAVTASEETKASNVVETSNKYQRQWYHVSDSHVRTATVSEVLKAQAYILFYERLP